MTKCEKVQQVWVLLQDTLHRDQLKSSAFIYEANRGAVPGSSGDEIGKALASVSSCRVHIYNQVILLLT